jgi:predicted AAA+ superfamily ATPase
MLIGRTNEKLLLEEALSSNRSELVVVYGRRRVGKTLPMGWLTQNTILMLCKM